MELTEEVKELLIKTAKELKGSARRLFMARTVRALGEGGQRRAEQELGWNCGTIRKGEHELESGMVCIDASRHEAANAAKSICRTCSMISQPSWMGKVKLIHSFGATVSIPGSQQQKFVAS